MKTLRYEEIDGYKIFLKFDELPVDPRMTEILNKNALEALPEQVAVDKKIAEKNTLEIQKANHRKKQAELNGLVNNLDAILANAKTIEHKQAIQAAAKNAPAALKQGQKTESIIVNMIDTVDQNLTDLNSQLLYARKMLLSKNLVFAHPRRHEVPIPADMETDLENFDIPAEKALSLDIIFEDRVVEVRGNGSSVMAPFPVLQSYELIDDLRGKQFWYQLSGVWESTVINRIGFSKEEALPGDGLETAIETSMLSLDQREEIRIQSLTDEQKTAEKDSLLQEAIREAAFKKNEYEILGDAEPLKRSQDWYNAQVEIISAKYE